MCEVDSVLVRKTFSRVLKTFEKFRSGGEEVGVCRVLVAARTVSDDTNIVLSLLR
jgi:hypothetical protein